MGLVTAFVNNPVKVSVGVLLLALFGLIALDRLPMQLTPEVQIPTITVTTRWPGASPVEVEREIVQEQEEQLKSVEGLVKLSSESSDSSGTVILEFGVGTDMGSALLKVNARLQQVREYPEEADEPVITTSSSNDSPIAWFILRPLSPDTATVEAFQDSHPELREVLEPVRTAHGTGLRMARLERVIAEHPAAKALAPADIDITELRRFAEDNIEATFERVAGVSNSNVLGGREEELQVVVDPRQLASRGLTIDDLRQALRLRNKDTSGGDFWESKRRYVVRTLGRLKSPEEVRSAVVARRDGKPVYVRDVAEVRLGHKKPDGWVKNFGTTSIAVNCLRETGANVLDVMAGLRVARDDLNETLLHAAGLHLEQVYDETEYIDSAVGLVNQNIVVGGILTVIVLLLFLRSARSTLVLALAIPTSLVGTFLVLDLLGRSLNVVSLAGLAFAVGMLVDNAVVVLENIYRRYQNGEDRVTAAVRGTQEVWGAVVASTLTTLAVFLPVL
ncbi:MAG: efflux RND transporter permease subunit, partial [Planctomycetes bacterium]|nr:efflux RND transporter permease subunit [Planctomycetota bacterium]